MDNHKTLTEMFKVFSKWHSNEEFRRLKTTRETEIRIYLTENDMFHCEYNFIGRYIVKVNPEAHLVTIKNDKELLYFVFNAYIEKGPSLVFSTPDGQYVCVMDWSQYFNQEHD